ncbi:MAG: hypothetical protein JWM80_215 [Cyanobacteria bacterium RYN_339]|nr:hypothetical protein [Cyanobacteria bacterium RYN_339]
MHSIRPLLASLLTLALAAPAFARASNEVNVFAWQATKAGAKPDILVGTMHVAVGGGQHLPAALLAKLKTATRFAMEVDLKSVNPASVAHYITLAPTDSLKKQMKPAAWAKLVALGGKHGLEADQIDHLAPWYIGMAFLDITPPADQLMDALLREAAERGRLPTLFLETADDQFKALSSVTRKEELAQLQELLDNPSQPKEELAQLTKAYMGGDLEGVKKLLFEPDRIKQYPDFYKKLFYDRNARWTPKLTAMLAKDDAFVAVGLGHLIGAKGLLAVLEKQGYKVTPLPL